MRPAKALERPPCRTGPAPQRRDRHLRARAERRSLPARLTEPACGRHRRVAAGRPAKLDRPASGGLRQEPCPPHPPPRSAPIRGASDSPLAGTVRACVGPRCRADRRTRRRVQRGADARIGARSASADVPSSRRPGADRRRRQPGRHLRGRHRVRGSRRPPADDDAPAPQLGLRREPEGRLSVGDRGGSRRRGATPRGRSVRAGGHRGPGPAAARRACRRRARLAHDGQGIGASRAACPATSWSEIGSSPASRMR